MNKVLDINNNNFRTYFRTYLEIIGIFIIQYLLEFNLVYDH